RKPSLSPLPAALIPPMIPAYAQIRIDAINTNFRWLGPNDKIVVERYDDPKAFRILAADGEHASMSKLVCQKRVGAPAIAFDRPLSIGGQLAGTFLGVHTAAAPNA